MTNRTECLSIVFRGGPANRFYEYHTATYLAKRWHKTFVVDPTRMLPNGMQHDPDFRISNFFECETEVVSKYHLVIRQFDDRGRINPYWKDELLNMDAPEGNVLLTDGWYQTFWSNHNSVPKLPRTRINFDTKKTIFIHVRRGDYINSRIFVDLDHYFKRSYEKMEQLFDDSTYLICSDDIHWCKSNLNYIEKPLFVENTGYQETLWLMSQCERGAILSNSTFGLWGAYLARISHNFDPCFKVLIPNRWTSLTHIRNYDIDKYIYPPWSERIEV